MNQNQPQRKGKPGNQEMFNTNQGMWLQNKKVKKLRKLILKGQHHFQSCSRKQVKLSNQEKKKKQELEQICVNQFGLAIQKNEKIALFDQFEDSLMNIPSQNLLERFTSIVQQHNAKELIDVYGYMNEQFITELIKIWEFINKPEVLTNQWLIMNQKQQQTQHYPLVIKNTYLNHVKLSQSKVTFQEFITNGQAQKEVNEFIQQAQEILND